MPDLNHLLDQIQERSDNFDRVQKDAADLELSLYSGQHDDRKILLKALRTVLDLHKPFQRNLWIGNPWQCFECVEEDGTGTTEPLLYPCPTVRAITDAMNGAGDETTD